MSHLYRIDLGKPSLLVFRGPDAVRYLNGQITQDVRRVVAETVSLPACVTDAKGKLQFRISIGSFDDGSLWVAGPAGIEEDLEARLTRYLIADDVEVEVLTNQYSLVHFTGTGIATPGGVVSRDANRFGIPGTDWLIPADGKPEFPSEYALIGSDELETFRIARGIPAWDHEITAGMLPPEALLDQTDISYRKGCYIGQEVISRVKSAGKVNRSLARFAFASDVVVTPGPLEDSAGEITSVAPHLVNGVRHALGYTKRNASSFHYRSPDGSVHPAEPVS